MTGSLRRSPPGCRRVSQKTGLTVEDRRDSEGPGRVTVAEVLEKRSLVGTVWAAENSGNHGRVPRRRVSHERVGDRVFSRVGTSKTSCRVSGPLQYTVSTWSGS